MQKQPEDIRNFSIIAHIDHGKSTLADRLIEICGGLEKREMDSQVLDSMDLEKERGITIKAQTASLRFFSKKKQKYFLLNLIDTPGHVDFSYEVSRSLSACEGAILVVDASQGVEAQTVANCYSAVDCNLEIIPVINKIDLPSSDPLRVCQEIEEIIGIDTKYALMCSAKTGVGVEEILEEIIDRIPAPQGLINSPLRALIIDSWFDNYLGVVVLVRIFDGYISPKDKIKFMSNGMSYICEQTGIFTPKVQQTEQLVSGEVGFIVAGIKELKYAKVGDTITIDAGIKRENQANLNIDKDGKANREANIPLAGFREIKPKVFAGIYPVESHTYEALRDALNKLQLNDSSLRFEPEVSEAIGFGFRCGFLGLLHMEIVQERLEREYDIDLITTAPTVVYQVLLRNGELVEIENPSKLPDPSKIEEIREPIIVANILVPNDYLGNVITLCTQKRGVQINMQYAGRQVMLSYEMPLNEVVLDFFDKLKSASRGYASFDYEFKGFVKSNLVKLDILVNGEKVDALSLIIHKENAVSRGRELVARLREIINRQMFDIAIQAAIGSQIIARESIKALRKNVLAKCYGGDITRKKKLLEKQKAGKKRMKQVGDVEIPQAAFLAILHVDGGKGE